MNVQKIFLGVLLSFAGFAQGIMHLDVKPGLREALQAEVDRLLTAGTCTAAQAAKLRGRFAWASSAVFGRSARGGSHALIQRQYFESDWAITPVLERSLLFLRSLAAFIQPRCIQLTRH